MKKTFKKLISITAAITLLATLFVPVNPSGEPATASAAVTAGENLLTNPGAENATTGWTMNSSGAKQWFAIGYPNNQGYPAPHGGTHYFIPGVSGYDELYQDIDITGAAGTLTFSGWMRDYKADHGDSSSLKLEIINNNGKVLAMTTSEVVTKTEQWTQKTISLTIPTGASIARATLIAKRNPESKPESVSDSYFDDLSLVYAESKDSADLYTPKKDGFVVKDTATGSIVEVINGKDDDASSMYGRYRGPIDPAQKKIVIPGEIEVNGQKVLITAISAGAFKNNKTITSVKISATDKTGTDGDPALKNATSTDATTTTAAPATDAALTVTPPPAPTRTLTIESKAFYGCANLKKITISSDLTLISKYAFYKCAKLSKITIPSKVTKIGKKAFYNCTALKTITIKTKKLTSAKVGASAFKGINKSAVITVPKKKYSAYKKLLKSKGVTLKTQKIKK